MNHSPPGSRPLRLAWVSPVTPAKLDVIEPGDAPCPFRIEGVDPSYGTYGAYDASPSGSVAPGAQPTAASLASDAATLTELDEVVRKGDATKSTLTQAQVLAESSRRVVFVVGVDNAPVVLDNEYIPGRSRGTAYVYGVVERRVVCAANFDVQNAPEIKVEYMTSNYDVAGTGNKRAAAELKLKGELYVRVKNAIAANLHAVR